MEYEKSKRDIFKLTRKQHDIMMATMELTAKRGIYGFSLSHVAQKAETSERLIYSYYGSKKQLLAACFALVNREMEMAYQEMLCSVSGQTTEEALRILWNTYFSTLVRGGYGALFYYAYRKSEFLTEAMADQDNEIDTHYFDFFTKLIERLNEELHVKDRVDPNVFWTYAVDITVAWAGRIIRGDTEDTAYYRESAWKLIFGGISVLIPEEK